MRIDGEIATVEVSGITHQANTRLVPEVGVGDYVLLHAGFAIQTLDEDEAKATLALFDEIAKAQGAQP